MAATAAMVTRLRRMIDEPADDPYTDDVLEGYIETYPLIDALGTDPLEVDYTTTPPTVSERDDWIPTYDMNSAAADVWEEKAASIAEDYDMTADGSTLQRSKRFEQYTKKCRYFRSRRSLKTIKMLVEPRMSPDREIVND